MLFLRQMEEGLGVLIVSKVIYQEKIDERVESRDFLDILYSKIA